MNFIFFTYCQLASFTSKIILNCLLLYFRIIDAIVLTGKKSRCSLYLVLSNPPLYGDIRNSNFSRRRFDT